MALQERLMDFPAKASPTPDDIVYVGNAAAGFAEVQSTIGEIISAYAALLSLAELTTSANQMIYTTGANTYAATSLTAFMRGVLAEVDSAGALAELGALPLAGGTMTGTLLLDGTQVADNAAATIAYVKNAVQNVHAPALVSTTGNLAGYTYSNGASGVGATLTAGGNGAFSADGVSPAINSRILVASQSSSFQNGIYTLSTVGTGGTPAILTRATDYDQASDIQAGDKVAVLSGTLYGGTEWMETAVVTTIGTDPITFLQQGNSSYLVKSANLSDLANLATALQNLGGGAVPTGTGALVRQSQPTINQANLVATTTNNNAATGSVGEFVSSFVPSSSGILLTTATATNITLISLRAGDWDLYGNVYIAFSVSGTGGCGWISLTSATLPDGPLYSGHFITSSALTIVAPTVPFARISLSAPANVYLSVYADFASGTATASGGIYARSPR